MPLMRISANYALKGAVERQSEWATTVSDEEMENLVPVTSSSPSGTGWAHWDEAEAHIVYGMKRNLFPDETTEVSKASDLKRLGVTSLRALLHDENGNTNSLSLI
jgi:hypothetical protein